MKDIVFTFKFTKLDNSIERLISQNIFNKCIKHLRKQKKKCKNIDGECCYFNGNLRDPVSLFLEKSRFDFSLNETSVAHIFGKTAGHKLHNFNDNQINLLDYLQQIHDSLDTYEWEEDFESCAKEYKLYYSKP